MKELIFLSGLREGHCGLLAWDGHWQILLNVLDSSNGRGIGLGMKRRARLFLSNAALSQRSKGRPMAAVEFSRQGSHADKAWCVINIT